MTIKSDRTASRPFVSGLKQNVSRIGFIKTITNTGRISGGVIAGDITFSSQGLNIAGGTGSTFGTSMTTASGNLLLNDQVTARGWVWNRRG